MGITRMTTAQTMLVVQGIEVMPLSEDFCTPDWQAIIDQYPVWARKARDANLECFDPQPYVLEAAKVIAKVSSRRTADEWVKRIIEHFGLPWFMQQITEMQQVRDLLKAEVTPCDS